VRQTLFCRVITEAEERVYDLKIRNDYKLQGKSQHLLKKTKEIRYLTVYEILIEIVSKFVTKI
jgi:hypothetical protein